MKFSALIPYKADFGRRDLLWSYVLKRYKKLMPQIEICVGIDQHNPFCRSKAVNNAAKKASGDVFLIVDADVIFEPELIEEIREQIPKHPWIASCKYGYLLTKEATDRLLGEGPQTKIQIKQEDILQNVTIFGTFLNAVPRRLFDDIGGFDERFIDWGGEDQAFARALETLCGPHFRLEGVNYHLWHEPANEFHPHYDSYINLLQRYYDATGNPSEMRKLINEWFS